MCSRSFERGDRRARRLRAGRFAAATNVARWIQPSRLAHKGLDRSGAPRGLSIATLAELGSTRRLRGSRWDATAASLPHRGPPPLGYCEETFRDAPSAARVKPSTAPGPDQNWVSRRSRSSDRDEESMALCFSCEARNKPVPRRRHSLRRASTCATRPKGRHLKTLPPFVANEYPASESMPRVRGPGARGGRETRGMGPRLRAVRESKPYRLARRAEVGLTPRGRPTPPLAIPRAPANPGLLERAPYRAFPVSHSHTVGPLSGPIATMSLLPLIRTSRSFLPEESIAHPRIRHSSWKSVSFSGGPPSIGKR